MTSQLHHPIPDPKNPKKVFRKLGTCSQTFFYILNREFEHPMEMEERAVDPLAGGILRRGHQCGMLWGASMAVGAEAHRRCGDLDRAISTAIIGTQYIVASFAERQNTVDCRDITHCDFTNKWSFAKYLLSGRFLYCFKMAEQWAPEAVKAAQKGLADGGSRFSAHALSCAAEVVKNMGGSDEEIVMVAGFAGGLGLGGHGCGALAAGIWYNTLGWCREITEKSPYNNPHAEKTLQTFQEVTNGRFLCSEITKRHFQSLDEHSDFIHAGGCKDLIDALAGSKVEVG